MVKLNLYEIEKYFSSRNLSIFATNEVAQQFNVKKRTAESFLVYNIKKGAIIRLKAGLFTLAGHPAHEFTVANRLYLPSYISLETALSYHHLIPETVYAITSITSKATREFKTLDRLYSYNKIKTAAFTGYDLIPAGGTNVYFANLEKAVADFLYFVFLGKKLYNDRLDWSKINWTKLEIYLKLFSQKKLIKFAKLMKNTYDRQK